MRVSEFLIGRGEVYVNRYGRKHELIEVVGVAPRHGGRHILIALHVKGQRVEGTERIVFGAQQFLSSYRPATAADCRMAEPTGHVFGPGRGRVNECARCGVFEHGPAASLTCPGWNPAG